MNRSLAARAASEALGTAFLLIAVVGSGIMAEGDMRIVTGGRDARDEEEVTRRRQPSRRSKSLV